MEKVYLAWRKSVKILLICTLLYIVGIPTNVLYTNTFVKDIGFLPARLTTYRIYGTQNYGMYGHAFGADGLHPDSIVGFAIQTYNVDKSKQSKLYLKTIVEYGFNFRDIYIKILDVNDEVHWLSLFSFPYEQNNKYKCEDYRYREVPEIEAKSQSRLIWINLFNNGVRNMIVWFFKFLDLINRTVVIPIILLIALILTVILLVRQYPFEYGKKIKYNMAVIFVIGFPLITWIIRHLICMICRLGLWVYTYI